MRNAIENRLLEIRDIVVYGFKVTNQICSFGYSMGVSLSPSEREMWLALLALGLLLAL